MTITCPRCSASYSLEDIATLDKQLSCVCGAVFDVQTALVARQASKIEETHAFLKRLVEIEEERERRFQESHRLSFKDAGQNDITPYNIGKNTSVSSIFITLTPLIMIIWILISDISEKIHSAFPSVSSSYIQSSATSLALLSIIPSIILAGVVNNIYRIERR